MSSINLLPKSFVNKKYLVNRKRDTFLISCGMLFISIVIYGSVFVSNLSTVGELSDVDLKLDELDVVIREELNENKSQLEEKETKDVIKLLENQRYYSKALSRMQNMINKDVYLTRGGFSFVDEEILIFDFSGFAKDYMAAIEQVAVFKDSFWINEVNVYDFSSEKDEGVKFEGNVVFKKDIISFSEDYYDFGLDIISSRTNRFLKVENYSAELIEFTERKYIVEIKFNGVAYDKEKLELFEESLKDASRFVTEALVEYDLAEKQESDFIKFKGKMKLSF